MDVRLGGPDRDRGRGGDLLAVGKGIHWPYGDILRRYNADTEGGDLRHGASLPRRGFPGAFNFAYAAQARRQVRLTPRGAEKRSAVRDFLVRPAWYAAGKRGPGPVRWEWLRQHWGLFDDETGSTQ